MKFSLIIFILFLPVALTAQSNADLQAMVDAERAFIKMAKEKNRRDAFLFFLSDSAVTQGPKGPTRGKARIQQQQVTNDWLYWEVAYSDISSSGDFGFNTGPWEFRQNKTDEKAVAWGEFNSIWKKQLDGSWKNVLDIGISHGSPVNPIRWATTNKPLLTTKEKARKVGAAYAAETTFQQEVIKDRRDAYGKYISPEVHLMVSGQLPFVGPARLDDYLKTCPVQGNPSTLGTETAASGDLGYVYGTVDVTLTKEGKLETRNATFVRVWKFEDEQWKIVLDVLTF